MQNSETNSAHSAAIHCPACNTDFTGDCCPICMPLERIRRAARDRRQFNSIRRKCIASFTEKSQPKERD